jgi:hypothetical protein
VAQVAQQVEALKPLGVQGEDAKAYLALSEELQGLQAQMGETQDPTVLSALKIKAEEVEADLRAIVSGQGAYVKVTYPGGARQTAVLPIPHFRRLQRSGEAEELIQSAEEVEVVGDETLNEEVQQKKGEMGNAEGAPDGFYENTHVSPQSTPAPAPTPTPRRVEEEERGETQVPHAESVKQQFREQFAQKGVKEEEIEGAIALMDARANSWASEAEGRTPEQWYDKIAGVKGGEFESGTQKQFQIVGEKAVLPEEAKANLQSAHDMEEGGKDARAIFLATGWERGADGKWRYEIPDGKTNDNFLKATRYGNRAEVGEVYEGAILEAYPELKGYTVEFIDGNGWGGSFNPKTKHITISYPEVRDQLGNTDHQATAENRRNLQQAESILLHELQHAVQSKEGFARGASPSEFKVGGSIFDDNAPAVQTYRRVAGETEARNVQTRAAMDGEIKKQTPLSETEDVARSEQILRFDNATMAQEEGGTTKGAVETLADGRVVIHALTSPDISTLVHEIAHVFEKDLTTAERSIIEKNGGSEAFARGFERYIRDGKAPNAELQPLFDKFRQWLANIYKTLKGSPIEKKVSPEVKAIFDRLLTDVSPHSSSTPTTQTREGAAEGGERNGKIKVFRGTGRNVASGENSAIQWVAEDRRVAENYAEGEQVEELEIEEPKKPFEMPSNVVYVRGNDVANRLRTERDKMFKAKQISREQYVEIGDAINEFAEVAGDDLELYSTKVNKQGASDAFVKALRLMGFDGLVQMESHDSASPFTATRTGNESMTYGIFKESAKSASPISPSQKESSERGETQEAKKERFREAILTALESANGSEFSEVISDIALQDSDRKTAVKNIRKGKSTVATRKVEEAIEKMWEDGYVYLNRGRGDHAESFQMPIEEFLSRISETSEAFADLQAQARNLQQAHDVLGEDLFSDAEEIIEEVSNISPQNTENELQTKSLTAENTVPPQGPADTGNEEAGSPGSPPTDATGGADAAGAAEGAQMIHAATAELRKETGLPAYEKKPETIEAWDEEAKARIAAGEMPAVLDKLRALRELTPVEVRMVGMQIATLAAKPPTPENLAALKEVIELSDAMGSRDGKNLRARQGTFLPDDNLNGQMIRRMEAAGVDELTETQKAEVEKLVEDLKRSNEDLTLKIAQLEEANLRLQAEAEVRAARKESKPRSKAKDYKKERQDIKAKIKEKWQQASKGDGTLTAVPVPYAAQLVAIAPDVARLMRSYVEEGVTTLQEVISRIHADVKEVVPEITEDDVRDMIAGVHNPPRPTKSELLQQVEDLRLEARLINQLEALENGEIPKSEKKQKERNQKIKELREKIKGLKDTARRDEAIARNIQKLETELDRVRERREKEPAESKERRTLTVREQALTDQIKAEKKKWADEQKSRPQGPESLEAIKKRNEEKLAELKEKLAKGDFTTKPKPKSALDNPELRQKHPELYQQTLDAIAAVDKARHDLHMANLKEEKARRPLPQKVMSHAGKTARTLKATLAGIDFSAIGVQNLPAILANPRTGVRGILASTKDAASAAKFERELAQIHSSEWWPLIEQSGLSIIDPKSLRDNEKSDLFNDTYYDDMVVNGKNVAPTKPFERAFTSLGNYIRINLFLRRAEKLLLEGKTFENSPEEFKVIAELVNNMTGRGTMGEKFENNSEMLSTVFWSPRLMASAYNLLGLGDLVMAAQGKKGFYGRILSSDQKAWAAGQIGRAFATGVVLMLAYAYSDDEADIDWDPTSVTFGYVKTGDYSWSIFGRFTKPMRYIAMWFTGTKTTERGEVE